MRVLFLIAGFAFLALALVGVLLPVMPTTIFLILAAGCFARSSPRLEAWLTSHATLGPQITRWRANGAISKPAKRMALGGMAVGLGIVVFLVQPGLIVTGVSIVALSACAAYVLSRPHQ